VETEGEEPDEGMAGGEAVSEGEGPGFTDLFDTLERRSTACLFAPHCL